MHGQVQVRVPKTQKAKAIDSAQFFNSFAP